MRRYVYGAVSLACVIACLAFFFNPPRTGNNSASVVLPVTFQLPEGYALTEGAPFALAWKTEGMAGKLSATVDDRHFNPLVSPYPLSLLLDPGVRAVVLTARLYYCNKISRMCFQGDFETRVPLDHGGVPGAWVWKIEPEKIHEP